MANGSEAYKQAFREWQQDYFCSLMLRYDADVAQVAEHVGMQKTYLYKLFKQIGVPTQARGRPKE